MKNVENWKVAKFEKEFQDFFDSIGLVYSISNFGNVKRKYEHKEIEDVKLSKATRYYTFNHYIKPTKKSKTFFVHRIVAATFLPNPEKEDQNLVIHLNYNRWNNRPENLRWVDKYQKERHAQANPDRPKQKGKITYSKLNASQVLMIKQKLKRGVKRKRLVKEFGVSEMQISRINSGECWGHVKLPEDGSMVADSKSERFDKNDFERDEYIGSTIKKPAIKKKTRKRASSAVK